MNKKQVLKAIITDDSCTRDYVARFMVDERTLDFKLMLRELQNDNPDHAKIGRLFQRAYRCSIESYVSMQK